MSFWQRFKLHSNFINVGNSSVIPFSFGNIENSFVTNTLSCSDFFTNSNDVFLGGNFKFSLGNNLNSQFICENGFSLPIQNNYQFQYCPKFGESLFLNNLSYNNPCLVVSLRSDFSEEEDSSDSNIARMTDTSINNEYFDKMLEHILSMEGGYVNDPDDSGGETNKGVTKATYDGYRRNKGLPTRSVREITQDELREIYYSIFTGSGADKINNPQMALMVFDTAVGSGCAKAKELFRESGGDIRRYEELRREWYADIVRRRPKDQKFINGWNNRVTSTMNFARENFPSSGVNA